MIRRNRVRVLITIIVFSMTLLSAAQGLNSVDSNPDVIYFNARPLPANAYRVLFIGDSLTYHTRVSNVWPYISGMAASSPQVDYVHLVAKHLQTKLGSRPVEILIDNGGNGKIGNMLSFLQSNADLKPNLVVLQGGENDPFDDNFKQTYKLLLDFFVASRVPVIVLGDWYDDSKRDFDREEALHHGYAWVDLTLIHKNPTCSGNPGPYQHKGVASHPNDEGMRAIAKEINNRFDGIRKIDDKKYYKKSKSN
jgi:hypothetical protein